MPRGINQFDADRLDGLNFGDANSSNIVAPGIVTDGLVVYLDAGNYQSYPIAGTTWYDLSDRRNNATLTNGPAYVRGGGGAIDFDGTDYAPISTSFVPPSTGSFTISFWSKSTKKASGSFHSFMSSRQLTTPFSGILITQDFTTNRSQYLRVQLNSSTQVNGYNSGTIGIPDNVFCNVTIIVDRNANLMRWYVNLTFDSQYDITGLGDISSTHALEIARDEAFIPNADAFLIGSVSNVAIYDRAITYGDLEQNFNALRARFNI